MTFHTQLIQISNNNPNSKKTDDMLYMTEEERPIVQQIFGSDINSFVTFFSIFIQ